MKKWMSFLVETWRNTIFPTSRFFLSFTLSYMCSQHVCGQLFSFAKSCLLALPNCSTDLVCGGFFAGMFQKSHPNFQDVKRVDLLESQNGRVRGEA